MLEEVEANRRSLFYKSIKELGETLKTSPENFQIKFKMGIGNFSSVFKSLFPNTTIILTKKGELTSLEFALIKIKGASIKKRKIQLLLNCEEGKESMY